MQAFKRPFKAFKGKKSQSEIDVASPSITTLSQGTGGRNSQPNVDDAITQSTGRQGVSLRVAEPETLLPSDRDEYGIKILYSPDAPVVDIVFVHGLTGGQLSTWTAAGARAPWPKLLLSEDTPEARISAFGYDADVVKFLGLAGRNKIRQHAINLLAGLADMRFDTGHTELPIIFVVHSLGGLVCQNALAIATNADQHQKRILDYTRAIAFLGTPHRGSELASWAKIAGNMVNLLKLTDTHILETLTPNSEILEIVTQEFHTMLRSREQGSNVIIRITCYAEELAVSSLGKSFMVVPIQSAILERYPYKTIHSDHRAMTKFGKRDDGYKKVSIELKRWIKEIKEELVHPSSQNPYSQSSGISGVNSQAVNGSVEESLKLLPYAIQAPFNSIDKQHNPTCHPDTRVDVFQKISEWADGDDERCIFWLSGLAGSGKTTIARTVARKYFEQKRLGASFFFSRGGGDVSNAGKFFTSIAVQLAKNLPLLKHHICEAISEHQHIASESFGDQSRQLIFRPLSSQNDLSSSSSYLLVIDALDECEGENDIKMILRLLGEARLLKTVRLRVFLTSRPEIPIRHWFNQIPGAEHQDIVLHQISSSIVDHDISIFLEYSLKLIQQKRGLDNGWPGEKVIGRLVQKASGLFIWAATAYRFIDEGGRHATKRLEKIIQDNPSGTAPEKQLDEIYITVLKNSISDSFNEEEKQDSYATLREILGGIALLFSPLSRKSLANLLHTSEEDVKQTLDDLHAILNIPEDQARPISLHHPSFRDFIINNERCFEPNLCIDMKQTHRDLADRCIRLMSTLERDVCGLERYAHGVRAPGVLANDIDKSRVQQHLSPEVQYACLYWVQHLQRGDAQLHDNSQVYKFLRERFLYWFEALGWMRKISEGILAMASLDSMIIAGESPHLIEFVHDAKRFALYNRSAIEQAPFQIYCSALIFAPNMSIIRRKFEDQMPRWVQRLSKVQNYWGGALQTLEGHSGSIYTVAFSPDGKQLASGSSDGTVRLWDPATGAALQTLEGLSGSIHVMAFSLDGKQLASGSNDGTVRLWDPATGAALQTLEGHSDWIRAVAFSPDGKQLASGSNDRTVRLWDPATGAALQTLEGHSGSINAVAFSPDGKQLASGSNDRTVRLWDPATGAALQTLEGHSGSINTVAFSLDGKQLASGSDDGTVRLWDPATGAALQTLEGHSDWIRAVAFSPDGKQLASGSDDGTVRLWDPTTGAALQTLLGHLGSIHVMAFSPDGKQLASGSDDGTVRLWDPTTGAALQILDVNAVVQTLSFSQDGLYLDTDKGVIHTASLFPPVVLSPTTVSRGIFVEEQWITYEMENVLWLPSEFRATSVAVRRNTVALGHASGHVTILHFKI